MTQLNKLLVVLFVVIATQNVLAEKSVEKLSDRFDCTDESSAPIVDQTVSNTPTEDFKIRDTFPATDVPQSDWHMTGRFGPCPAQYPKVVFPHVVNQVKWSRERVIEAAGKLIGTRYAHFHIPEMGGLDCSNFTSFVYNYAFGIRFSSNVARQAREAGRRLKKTETLRAGDLLYLYSKDRTRISHVVIYISPDEIIDSTGPGVEVRSFTGWYKTNFAWARRVIE